MKKQYIFKSLFLTFLLTGYSLNSFANPAEDSTNAENFADRVEDLYFEESGVLKPSAKNITFEDVLAGSVSGENDDDSDISDSRKSIIKDAATTYGIQSGASHRGYQINLELAKYSGYLDKIFDFRKVMLEEGVLPPVLSEGVNSYRQDSIDTVRTASHVYKIEFPARFISDAPTWRVYLTQNFQKPDELNETVLPKNKDEKKLWNNWVAEGWKMGVDQAQQSFTSSIGRLKRDFLGMIRYRKLYAKGMVSKPIVARSNLGVTGGGQEMSLNDRIYEITEKSALNPDKEDWNNAPEEYNPYK